MKWVKYIFLLSILNCFGISVYADEGIITTVAGNGVAGFSGDGGLAINAQFNGPVDVAIDSVNNLYIVESRNQRIRKVDAKGNISTVAGSGPAGPISGFSFGGFGGDGGLAISAKLDNPSGVAVDDNNNLYIADRDNYCIRKVDSGGIISTIIGVGNVSSTLNSYGVGDGGIATAAKFHQIEGVAIDNIGNVYIAEFFDHIRKVDISNIVSTVAGEIYGDGNSVPRESGFSGDGGPAVDALFSGISEIAIDSKANIYIADRGNHRIRKVDGNGIISTVVGNGKSGSSGDGKVAINAELVSPRDIEVDNNGNLYIADSGDCRIRKVSSTGIISTVAGNGKCGFSGDGGTATNAQIYPYGITIDNDGNLYIAEFPNNRIRKVTFTNNENTTIPNSIELPELGSGIALNNTGQFISTNTHFSGGVSTDGNNYHTFLQTIPSSYVKTQGQITVDPADVGKQADLLYVIAIELLPPFDGGMDTAYFTLDDAGNMHNLDLYSDASVWMPQLAENPFKRSVTLQNTMLMEDKIGQQLPNDTSASYYFIGYRLANGSIVYTSVPIIVTTSGANNPKPSIPKLVQLIPTNTDRVSLAWLPSLSDSTTADVMRYEVHLSEQANFIPSTNTLRSTVIGQHQVEITELDAGKTYNVLIIAFDQQGNQSENQDYRTFTTFTDSIILSNTTRFIQDKDVGLDNATTTDGVQFIYSDGGTVPETGSVLFANVGDETYLRKVDSIIPVAGGFIVQTNEAELTDIIEQGEINSEITLFDVNAEARRADRQASVRTSRSIRNDGQYTVMRWQDDVLVAEQIDDTENTTKRGVRDSTEEVEIKTSISFQPSVAIGFGWKMGESGPILTRGKLKVKGQLNANLDVNYNFKSSDSVHKEIRAIGGKKVFTMRYLIGGVPVYQRNILTVDAIIDASASSAIEANISADASATVEMGAEFDPQTNSWKITSPSLEFEKSLTEDIHLQGSVSGKVRFIPNLKTEFYRMVAGDVSIEPIVTGDISAETLGHADLLDQWGYLKTQLTQFDIHFQLEAFVGFSAGMFSKKFPLLAKTKVWESPNWLLFSLPQLSVGGGSGKVGEPIVLAAKTTNGENNPFNEGSVQWNVYPPGKATVSGGKTGSFTATEDGTYTVFFSGASRIPAPLGRQFAQAEVSVGKNNLSKSAHGIPDNTKTMQHNIPDNTQTMTLGAKDRCYKGAAGEHGGYVTIKENNTERKEKNGEWIYAKEDGSFSVATYSKGILNGYAGSWKADCKPTWQHGSYINGKKNGVWFHINYFDVNDWTEGKFSTDTFVDDITQGQHGEWNPDGTARGCHGNYVNNQPDGMWYCYNSKGKPSGRSGKYTNGKKNGVWFDVNYFDVNDWTEGRFKTDTFVDEIAQGPHGEWNPDGTARGCQGNYVNNQPDGMWYCYDYKSKPYRWSGKYTKGKKDGLWIEVGHGGEFQKTTFLDDIAQGPHSEWNADGTARGCHGDYVSNKQVGVWTCYKSDGTTYTETYVDGVKQK